MNQHPYDFTDEELRTMALNGLCLMNGTHPACKRDSQEARDAERLAPLITALVLSMLRGDDAQEVGRE